MSLSISTTALIPASYFSVEIARQRRRQVVFPNAATFAGQTWIGVKSCRVVVVVHSSVDPGPQLPSDPSGHWKLWLLGAIVSTILSFFSSKWGPLMKFKNEVEAAVENAERVTETVEKVAEEVDKVTKEIEENLPEGGKLRDAVAAVDEVAKTAAKDAELVEDVINKVEEVEKDVDSFMEADDEDKDKPPGDPAKGA